MHDQLEEEGFKKKSSEDIILFSDEDKIHYAVTIKYSILSECQLQKTFNSMNVI
jgi:alpha-acetolactate decarboxylase